MSSARFFLGLIVSLFTISAQAGNVLFYVSENGEPADTEFSISINGEQKAINKSGIAFFELPAGDYDATYFEFGEEAGGASFSLADKNNAEITIELVDGVPTTKVSVYTPGVEEAPPVGLVLGQVSSLEEGVEQGVEGANVNISGSNASIVTDELGGYAVQLARGVYDITVDHPQHGSRTISNVYVISGVTSQLNLVYSAEAEGDALLEEVVTVGQYQPNDIAQTERFSVTVIDALSAEQIARFGDTDAAASLKRVSGVTTDRGQFAIVRGLSGRYVSSTLNGIVTPSTDPLRRDAPLDLFPSGVLESISVRKGFSPEAPGDSTGGYIEIKTKGIPEERVHKLRGSIGINSQNTFNDYQTYDGGDRDFFGFDDGTRELPNAVNSVFNGGRSTGAGASAADLEAAGESLENVYNVDRETAEPEFSLGYSNGNLYNRGERTFGYYFDLNFSRAINTQQNGVFAGPVRNDAGDVLIFDEGEFERSTVETGFSAYFVTGVEYDNGTELTSKTLLSRETEDLVQESLNFEVSSSGLTERDTLLQFVERQLLSQQFSGTHFPFANEELKLDWRAAFSRTNREEPDRREYALTADATVFENNGFDVLGLDSSTIRRSFGDLEEDAIDLGVDFEFPVSWNDTFYTTFKTGLSYLTRERTSSFAQFGFTDTTGLITGNDPEAVLTDDNIGPGGINLFNASQASDFYDANWDIASFYASSETTIGDQFTVLAGARFEGSEQEVTTSPVTATSFNAVGTNILEEDSILPAAALTWASLNEKHQVKLGYSRTVSRPDFTELSNAIFLDPVFNFEVRGNPNLQISDIDNVDLRYEYYLNNEDSISVAYFYKDISNPIEQIIVPGSGNITGLRSYENAVAAEVQGIEVDGQKTFYENDFYSWFLFGNLSFIDSEVTLSPFAAAQEGRSSLTRRLQGQSDWIVNLILGFNDYKRNQEATLLLNVAGDRISEVGAGTFDDIILEPFVQLDFTYKLAMNERLDFKARIENILNDSVERTQAGETASEFDIGVTFRFGVEYKL